MASTVTHATIAMMLATTFSTACNTIQWGITKIQCTSGRQFAIRSGCSISIIAG